MVILVNIAIIVAIVLTLIELRLKKRIEISENSQELAYIKDLKVLESSNQDTESKLYALSAISKDFFKQKFNLDPSLTYSELAKKFRQSPNKNHKKYASFCEAVLIAYYTKERITKQKISSLINTFIKVIEKSLIEKEIERKKEIEKQKQINPISIIPKIKGKFKIIFRKNPQELQIQEKPVEKPTEIKKPIKIQEQEVKEIKPVEKPKHQEKIEISKKPQKEFSKQEIEGKIEEISYSKLKINDLINDIYLNKDAKELINEKVKSDKDLQNLFEKNPEMFNKFNKLSKELQQINEKFNSLFDLTYDNANNKIKRILESLTAKWEKERKKKLRKNSNPLNNQIIESELLYKYFMKFRAIIKILLNKKESL
jgi:hypothetical protein